MGDKVEEYVGFACFRPSEVPKRLANVRIAETREEIAAWKAKAEERVKDSKNSVGAGDHGGQDSLPKEKAEEPETQIEYLMDRFRIAISGFHALIETSSLMMPLFRAMFIDTDMLGYAKAELNPLEDDGTYQTFGITSEKYPGLIRHIDRLVEIDQAVAVLPGAVLLMT